MTRRSRAVLVVVTVLAAALAVAIWRRPVPVAPAPHEPVNVILITIDTLRWDRVGAYGARAAATPVLDGIASRGVRFVTAIAQAPLTAPSHASILTGAIPPRHGVRDNGGFALPDHLPLLATTLQKAGYRTGAFVSGFPLDRRYGFARGFDHYDDRLPRGEGRRRADYVERRADATTDRAIAWLDGTSRPFFLWVHYFDPHAPYEPPASVSAQFRERPYDGEVAFVDQEIGRLVGAIDRSDARGRTFVLVTADHGEALGEHGEENHGVFLYDATLRVPWIMEGPGLPKAVVPAVLARGVDVMPTLLDLCGVPAPPGLDGRSLAAAARGGTLEDEPAYAESLFAQIHFGWAPLFAWRTPRWKYIESPRPELYAVDTDPGETIDRASSEQGVAADLRRRVGAAHAVTAPDAAVAPDAAAAGRLRALGYASGAPAPGGADSATNPKDRIALVNRMWDGIALVDVDPPRAARELEAVLAVDPDVHLARRHLAMARANAGDRRRAMEQIEHLIRGGSGTSRDYLLLGEWRRASGDSAGATAAVAEAARLDPTSPEPLIARARAALGDKDFASAAAAFEAVLSIAPDHPEALRGLADVAMARGDLGGATARFERIVATDPEDADARVKLGVLRVRGGRLDEGVALFRDAVALDPENGEALLTLGGALAKTGRPAEAVPYFERAVAAGLRTPVAFNSLGAARMESGDPAGALAAFRASVSVDPRQPQIRALVATLEARSGRQP